MNEFLNTFSIWFNHPVSEEWVLFRFLPSLLILTVVVFFIAWKWPKIFDLNTTLGKCIAWSLLGIIGIFLIIVIASRVIV